MNPHELLRLVDAIHREKNIDKDVIFKGIEAGLVSAAKKHYGENEEIAIQIDRISGAISATHNGVPLDPEETSGRIGAQTAKQVIIQKIREAERDAQFGEFEQLKGRLVTGIVQRNEGNKTIVALSKIESILPRSEQVPGDSFQPNDRVRATVCDVRKAGSRVQVVLSRVRNDMVQRLFEQEIPEISDGVIVIKAVAREAGYRTKVAVHSMDQRVDCQGACVGVRGSRIKNIVDELGGERIDVVRWHDSLQLLIANSLQPASVEEVILCPMLGRAIVLVNEDQLSLAIGRKGQNVRLASKLCGWDIDIMTNDELGMQIERAVGGYSTLEGVTSELADKLVGAGFLSYDDSSIIEPDDLQAMGDLSEEQTKIIIAQAEARAEEEEKAVAIEKRRAKEQARILAAGGTAAAPPVPDSPEELKSAHDEMSEGGPVPVEAGETEASATEAGATEASETEASETEAGATGAGAAETEGVQEQEDVQEPSVPVDANVTNDEPPTGDETLAAASEQGSGEGSGSAESNGE